MSALPEKDKHGRPIPENPAYDRTFHRFQKNIDREALEHFLVTADYDRYETFLLLLHDPNYSNLSMSTLARRCGITLHELQEVYTNGMRHLALLKITNVIPDLVDDLAEDAKSKMENCPRCDGFQTVPDHSEGSPGFRICPACKGNGEIRRSGDKHSRDLLFESSRLIKQSGPLVAIQNNISTGDTRLEDMLKKTRQIVLEPTKDDG